MGIFDKVWDITTDVLHSVTGLPTADQKRNAARMVTDQMNAYKKQTELAQSVTEQARQERLMNKRRLDEKQVAAIRGRFAPSGFLGQSDPGSFPDTLGA